MQLHHWRGSDDGRSRQRRPRSRDHSCTPPAYIPICHLQQQLPFSQRAGLRRFLPLQRGRVPAPLVPPPLWFLVNVACSSLCPSPYLRRFKIGFKSVSNRFQIGLKCAVRAGTPAPSTATTPSSYSVSHPPTPAVFSRHSPCAVFRLRSERQGREVLDRAELMGPVLGHAGHLHDQARH